MPRQTQRGQGQWALGHLEPLNAAERFKKDDDGLNVRQRILTRYAQTGFDSIDPLDLRGRFRWWGLYTQRRPGIGGGKTGALEDTEIEDAFFMMRVRIPGGQLSAEQLRTVAGIAKEYGRDLADITDRQNVQFHWIGSRTCRRSGTASKAWACPASRPVATCPATSWAARWPG
jgi:sulfite reductase (ferredoxin)